MLWNPFKHHHIASQRLPVGMDPSWNFSSVIYIEARAQSWILLSMLTMPLLPCRNAGAFDFKGKYKWQAWKDLEGMSKDVAQAKYVAMLRAVSPASIINFVRGHKAERQNVNANSFRPAVVSHEVLHEEGEENWLTTLDAREIRWRRFQEDHCRIGWWVWFMFHPTLIPCLRLSDSVELEMWCLVASWNPTSA